MSEQSSPTNGKRTASERLWEILQTLSDEAQQAARRKAIELGYSLERGDVPFEETLINLSLSRDALLSAISNSVLPELPLKVQEQIVADAQKVSVQLQALINGTDAIPLFVSAVEDLHSDIWYSQLRNLSGEILGFQQKLNQLKALEKALRELGGRAEAFKLVEARAHEISTGLDSLLGSSEKSSKEAADFVTVASKAASDSKDAEQRALASLTVAQQSEKSLADSSASARSSSSELEEMRNKAAATIAEIAQARQAFEALSDAFKGFQERSTTELASLLAGHVKSFKELDDSSRAEYARLSKEVAEKTVSFSSEISTSLKIATDTVQSQFANLSEEMRKSEAARVQVAASQLATSKAAFDTEASRILKSTKEGLEKMDEQSKKLHHDSEERTSERFAELKKLEDVIREKILLATNYQLFHAFQTRQFEIAKGVKFWRLALFSCLGSSFFATLVLIACLIWGHPTYNAAFFLKLGFTIPLIYAVHFCSTQYSEERKLEEEYAFKGNISISLEPYRELVEKLVNRNDPIEAAKYSDFVLTSIGRVFTSPTERVVSPSAVPSTASGLAESSKGMTNVLNALSDFVQSLTKLK